MVKFLRPGLESTDPSSLLLNLFAPRLLYIKEILPEDLNFFTPLRPPRLTSSQFFSRYLEGPYPATVPSHP